MKHFRILSVVAILLLPMAVQGLDFDPPLNQGIQFPETVVEETSTVELTISNRGNANASVRFEAPQNQVFELNPAQVQIGGGQDAVMEFSFTPERAGQVQE